MLVYGAGLEAMICIDCVAKLAAEVASLEFIAEKFIHQIINQVDHL